MSDTQDSRPQVMKKLDRVGVTNLRTLVETNFKDRMYRFTPKTEITIDLEKDKKGIHMSRLIEAITEAVEEETAKTASSIEDIQKSVLERLSNSHPYVRGEVSMETDLFIRKKTPKTGKKTNESHTVKVTVVRDGGEYTKKLKVVVLGNTVCPHSMATAGKPHIQRAEAELEIVSEFDRFIELEDMVECVEKSFSSEVYTLLKTEDEKYVVEKMYANPKFVEDVVRDILDAAGKRYPGCAIHAKVVSHESIHRHDVIAEGSINPD